MRLWLAVLLAPIVAIATPAAAQGARNTPPSRVPVTVAVFGTDPCPKGDGDEIVVCARYPEAERYRIPKKLRDEKADERKEQSWVARSRLIDQAGSENRPDSCSAVGSGGQTGCFQKFMHDARVQKQEDAAAANDVP